MQLAAGLVSWFVLASGGAGALEVRSALVATPETAHLGSTEPERGGLVTIAGDGPAPRLEAGAASASTTCCPVVEVEATPPLDGPEVRAPEVRILLLVDMCLLRCVEPSVRLDARTIRAWRPDDDRRHARWLRRRRCPPARPVWLLPRLTP